MMCYETMHIANKEQSKSGSRMKTHPRRRIRCNGHRRWQGASFNKRAGMYSIYPVAFFLVMKVFVQNGLGFITDVFLCLLK